MLGQAKNEGWSYFSIVERAVCSSIARSLFISFRMRRVFCDLILLSGHVRAVRNARFGAKSAATVEFQTDRVIKSIQ